MCLYEDLLMSTEFEPNNDKLQTHEVDWADTKTSKLEAAIKLAKIVILFIGSVWLLLTIGSVLNITLVNSEQAGQLSRELLPVITMIATALLFYVIGKNQK